MYVVGFNGPPECGKDTLAKLLADHMDKQGVSLPVKHESLSFPLREIAYKIVGWAGELDGPNYAEFKRTIFPIGGGITGRQLMIDASEEFLKRCYSERVMADMMLSRNIGFHGVLLVRDCGFQCEVSPIIDDIGPHNFYLVNIMREDKDFVNDSREWVNHPDSKCQMQVNNNYSLDDLATEAGRIYGRLVNQMGWTL